MIHRISSITLSILLESLQFVAFAATPFSLSDCIRAAIEKNPSVQISQTEAEVSELALRQSRNAYIPSLSISNQHNLSTGRVLDPTTYQFLTNRTVYDMNAAIGGTMRLFSGFERLRTVEKAKINLQSALLEAEKTKNDLALNVTALFLNIVLDKEAVKVCESRIALLQKQEELIACKVEYKAATSGDLLNVQADITNAKVDLTTAQSNLDLDKLAMCEVLGIDDWQEFDISIDTQDYEDIKPRLWCESDITAAALDLPQIRQSQLAIDIAKKDISIASSSFWPSLSLNAGYGSTFSNARTKTTGEEYNFRDQLRDNMSLYVTISLNIPILSAISVSNSVRQKRLSLINADYRLNQSKLTLYKEVKQALVNANAAYAKYTLLTTDEQKYTEALRQTEEKYNAGTATYYDYQIAVGNLYQAQAQRLQTKYEYIFRTKIIGFYAGESLY